MTTRKRTPSLSEIVGDLPTAEETPETDTAEIETEISQELLIPSNEDHVHTWKEDHMQNLAKLQKDAIVSSPPSEHAGVSRVVTETQYAKPSENDDTGRVVYYMDETEDDEVAPNAGSVE